MISHAWSNCAADGWRSSTRKPRNDPTMCCMSRAPSGSFEGQTCALLHQRLQKRRLPPSPPGAHRNRSSVASPSWQAYPRQRPYLAGPPSGPGAKATAEACSPLQPAQRRSAPAGRKRDRNVTRTHPYVGPLRPLTRSGPLVARPRSGRPNRGCTQGGFTGYGS